VGFDKFAPSLATERRNGRRRSRHCGEPHPAASRARLAATRTDPSTSNWSLQRTIREQPFWALWTLGAMLGQIGLPAAASGASYGPTNIMGSGGPLYSGRALP